MQTIAITSLALLATTAAAVAQSSGAALLHTTRATETSLSGTGGAVSLAALEPRAIHLLGADQGGCNRSSETFLPELAIQTLAGDEDGDGDVHTPGLTRNIDAVLVKPYRPQEGRPSNEWLPRNRPVDALEVFYSVKEDVGTTVSGLPGLRRGDCGRFTRTPAGNGQVEHFITAEQLIDVLGMFDRQTGQRLRARDVDLDGITVSRDGHIFVSFEDDHALRLLVGGMPVVFVLEDGAIAWIPPQAWLADARGNVASVVSARGRIAFTEAGVDAMVASAAVADHAGGCPTTIRDTDGLTLDPNGGAVVVRWDNQPELIPNLWFCGETLTGAGVLSTAGGGTIAVLNGCRLAAPCGSRTDAKQLGLADTGSVDSLDGLESLARRPCRFVLDSPTPTGLGGAIQVDIGHDLAPGPVLLLFGIGTLPVSPSIAFTPLFPGRQCFAELYTAVVGAGSVVVPVLPHALGGNAGSFTLAATPVIPNGVVMQAVVPVAGGFELSTPLTLH